jgi:hypothetical protein
MEKTKYLLCFILVGLFLTSCQRFEKQEHRTGLSNDSRSYSYVGYDESRMKTAAFNVKGVQNVYIDYHSSNIMVYIIPEKKISTREYTRLAKEVRRQINIAAPLNPFKIKVLPEEEYFKIQNKLPNR